MSPRLRPIGALLMFVLLAGCDGSRLPFEAVATPSASATPSNAIAGASSGPSTSADPQASASAAVPASAEASAATSASAEASTAAPASAEASAATQASAPAATASVATLESLAQNPMPPRDSVALAYQFGRIDEQNPVVGQQPLDVQVGDIESFWMSDLENDTRYEIEASLVYALDHVLVYVENGVDVDLEALERDAQTFNDQIYPRNRELFGSEWTPGIDGDVRLTILNARIPGAGGYFSSRDEVPASVNRYSNEREMFYINVEAYPPGSDGYLSTLAHEFQHMIEYNEGRRSTTWFNEGMSQLAEELNGFGAAVRTLTPAYLVEPDLQLTGWGSSPGASTPHYAASYLFMSYLYQHYSAQIDLRRLIQLGAGEQLELLAELARAQNGAIADFGDLYADWSSANLLNAPSLAGGRYSYTQLTDTVEPVPLETNADATVAQFGSDYLSVPAARSEQVLRFDGGDTIGVVSTQPQGTAMWWSNRGDTGASTLERRFDLRSVAAATLEYRLWYAIEDGWDYGYVAVSADGGQSWQTLAGRYTTTEDPQGLSQGNGYTGISGGGDSAEWVDEAIDLSPYAGSEIVLRFGLVTDDATNLPGMVLDDLRIPELGYSDNADSDDGGWLAAGFARTDNRFPQRWELRFVRGAGNAVAVETLALDGQNRAELRLAPGESGTLIVMATTPYTTERATYRIENVE